jgi:hypothetical protein
MRKQNTFAYIKAIVNKHPMNLPALICDWARNAETFYVRNLIKLGYIEKRENGAMYILKRIPEDYNSSSLRKEMKEKKNLMKI